MKLGSPSRWSSLPMLFTIGLGHLLKKDDILKAIIDEGHLIAFADDMLFLASQDELWKIAHAMRYLEQVGMSTNAKKCLYLSHKEHPELEVFGVRKDQITYLGAELSFDKPAMLKAAQHLLATK